MLSDKNYLIYQVLDRARLVPCTREQAIERAEEGKKLIAKIDSLRQDYTGKFQPKKYIPIYPTGDK